MPLDPAIANTLSRKKTVYALQNGGKLYGKKLKAITAEDDVDIFFSTARSAKAGLSWAQGLADQLIVSNNDPEWTVVEVYVTIEVPLPPVSHRI